MDQAGHLETLLRELDPLFEFSEKAPHLSDAVHDKWAIVAGVSMFADPLIPPLCYPKKDAQDMQTFLVQHAGFDSTHVRTLLDRDATGKALTSCLTDWLPSVVQPTDLVFLFISSHGTPAYMSMGAGNSLVTYDTTIENLFTTSIPMQKIVRLLRSKLHNQHVFVFLDTCYAGGLDVPEAVPPSNVDPHLLVSSRRQLLVSSSATDERSWESKRYHNSVFTRQLVDTLSQNPRYKDFHTLFQIVRERVVSEVSADYHNKQTPQLAGLWSGKGLMEPQGKTQTSH